MTQQTAVVSSQGSGSNSSENYRSDRQRELLEQAKNHKEAIAVLPESFHDELRRNIQETGEEYMKLCRSTAVAVVANMSS